MKSKNLHVGSYRPGRFRPLIPALVWAATIFVLSSFPGSAYPPTDLLHADKLVHVAIYGLLGALCARGFLRGWGWTAGLTAAAAGAAATAYGLSDELHQWFVPGRNADWRDVAADAAGAVLGAALMVLVARGRGRGGARVVR